MSANYYQPEPKLFGVIHSLWNHVVKFIYMAALACWLSRVHHRIIWYWETSFLILPTISTASPFFWFLRSICSPMIGFQHFIAIVFSSYIKYETVCKSLACTEVRTHVKEEMSTLSWNGSCIAWLAYVKLVRPCSSIDIHDFFSSSVRAIK